MTVNINKKTIDVLLVDDDEADRRLATLAMTKSSQATRFNIETAETLFEATERLGNGNYDIILLDIGLPDSNGIDTVRRVHDASPEIPLIVLTGLTDEEMGLEAIKSGAEDYVVKGNSLEYTLVIAVRYAIERKQSRNALEAAKKHAEESALAKSRVLANMSHEIRTPMNAIVGFIEMLAEQTMTDEQKDYINIIRESAHNLLHLIDDILDFSKIEAGKLHIEIVDCSLGVLLAAVETLIRPTAVEKNLAFEIRRCSVLPVQIRTDPVRLRQCLTNLVQNGVKFTKEGHVYVNVSLQYTDDKPYLRFDIEDTGIGIPADKQRLIFDQFSQADGSTTRKFGGTGLGLAITKQLVHLLGGKLTLSSEVDKGSVFSLIIPVGVNAKSQPAPDNHPQSTEAFGGDRSLTNELSLQQATPETPGQDKFSGRALIVEDSPTNRLLTKVLLEKLGLHVTIACDGSEAIDKVVSQEFDVIFMDMQMPDMNGYETTKVLREKGIAVPIVALTANVMEGDDKKCIETGCDDYLAKPIDRRELLKTIAKYLPSRSEDLSEKIDSVKTQVDELNQLCSDAKSPGTKPEETTEICNNEAVINWTIILEVCGDEDMVIEMVKIFLDDTPRSIELIADAIKAENPKDVELYAHRLKGSARHVAAEQLSEKAYRLECASRGKDIAAAASIFEEVRDEFEKAMSFLSKADWIEIAKQQANK